MRIRRQSGFVLLLIVVGLVIVGGAAVLFGISQSAARRQYVDPVVAQNAALAKDTLDAAKQALFQYVLSPPGGVPLRPGVLPTPDSLAYKLVVGDGVYDGIEDNKCLGNTGTGLPGISGSNSTLKRCLGRIPWKTLNLALGDVAPDDPTGAIPWLAISANLVLYDNCLKVFNSDVAALVSPVTLSCPSITGPPYPQPTSLPHPWLSVRDGKGQILSDKVAAVLILPGPAIQTETRNQSRPAGNPTDYLDSVQLPLGCASGCTVYDNGSLNNDVVQIPLGTRYPDDAEDLNKRGQLVPFNDVLVYITVDELMYYVEQRVLRQMSKSLKEFKSDPTTGFTSYPWMAPLTTALVDETSLYSQAGTIFGAFPFMTEYLAGTTLPFYRTGFGWALSGATESLSWISINGSTTSSTLCYQISTFPAIWIRNSLQGSLNGSTSFGGPFASNTGVPSNAGTCKWLGTSQVSCEYDAGTSSRQFNLYSTQTRCNNGTPILGTDSLSVKRKVILLPVCISPNVNYQSATVSMQHQWTWQCANMNQSAIVSVEDTISNINTPYGKLPRIANLTSGGSTQGILVSGITYNPIMPYWFYENRWYLTAFSARSPALAPQPTTNPCGGATSLSVADVDGRDAVVLLAGRAANGQIRPSNKVNDYLEGKNQTASSTCIFENPSATGQSTMQDPLLVVNP